MPGARVSPAAEPPRGFSGRAGGFPEVPGRRGGAGSVSAPPGRESLAGETEIHAFTQETRGESLLCALGSAEGPAGTPTAEA